MTVIARPQKGAVTEQLGGAGDNPLRRGKSVVLLEKPDFSIKQALLVSGTGASSYINNSESAENVIGQRSNWCVADPAAFLSSVSTGE